MPSQAKASSKKATSWAALALAVLMAGYAMARPSLQQATGWELPDLAQWSGPADPEPVTQRRVPVQGEVQGKTSNQSPPKEVDPAAVAGAKTAPLKEFVKAKATDPETATRPKTAPTVPQGADLKFGLLREQSRDRYISPAGLLFTPGSEEGHRLKHLERHTVDQPDRPGKHGVFDGGMAGALQTIDAAYQNAQAGRRTTKQIDQGRTVYTVDMGKRVGFIGGRDGNRSRRPMARRVRLVLDGNRVITAFPL